MPIILDEKELEKLRKSKRRAKRAQSVRSSQKVEREFRRQISELWMKILLPTTQRIKDMIKAGASTYEIAIVIEEALRWANTEYEMASYNLIDRWRGSLDKETRWALNDSLRKALGIDTSVIFDNPIVAEGLKVATMEASSLIRSIPGQYLGQVAQAVADNFTGKELPEGRSLMQQIQHLGGVSQRRAKMIARDQTSKVTGSINQIRQQSIGIEEYIWRTSRDQRVVGNPAGTYPTGNRKHEDHYHREGKRFRWDSPPEDGHPGQAILCRCHAEPIIDPQKIISFAQSS